MPRIHACMLHVHACGQVRPYGRSTAQQRCNSSLLLKGMKQQEDTLSCAIWVLASSLEK